MEGIGDFAFRISAPDDLLPNRIPYLHDGNIDTIACPRPWIERYIQPIASNYHQVFRVYPVFSVIHHGSLSKEDICIYLHQLDVFFYNLRCKWMYLSNQTRKRETIYKRATQQTTGNKSTCHIAMMANEFGLNMTRFHLIKSQQENEMREDAKTRQMISDKSM